MAITLNSSTLVTVFGGSGFVGRYVVQALAKTGCRVRVAVRRPHGAIHLQPLGSVGQIHAVQANLRDEASVRRAVEGVDGVVNLVGILAQSGKQSFSAVQAKGAGFVAQAARDAGAAAIVHVSAIGADRSSRSAYARTKAEAWRIDATRVLRRQSFASFRMRTRPYAFTPHARCSPRRMPLSTERR
jgi:NADH dehydrogenase